MLAIRLRRRLAFSVGLGLGRVQLGKVPLEQVFVPERARAVNVWADEVALA